MLALTRPGSPRPGIRWDPARGEIDAVALEGVDAVVHLAGENVAGGRWTEAQKRRIEQSRVESTGLLARTLAGLSRKPAVLISASAVGYYGAHGNQPIDESAGPGADFLARVCVQWEASAQPARAAGIRVVHPRFGLVLHPSGGALARMLPAFRLFAGGKLGSGEQGMSWVALEDAIAALEFALTHAQLTGPFNVTAPEPVSNAEFTRALASALGRPAVMTVPRFALRALFGEMAEVALLSGACVNPARLLELGFSFQHATLGPYLEHVLGRSRAQANGLS